MYGDTFPHEADMDQLAGVDFDKGCYVGQEVVSRVEHRASARSRVVPVAYDGPAPSSGPARSRRATNRSARSARPPRVMGSRSLRLDRIADALAAGHATVRPAGSPLRAVKPDWATFDWPGEPKAAT